MNILQLRKIGVSHTATSGKLPNEIPSQWSQDNDLVGSFACLTIGKLMKKQTEQKAVFRGCFIYYFLVRSALFPEKPNDSNTH
jgi:hypothetical protein